MDGQISGRDMGYELKSARFLAQEVLRKAVSFGDTAIDATMGNGHDTLLLCQLVGPEGHVFAFDVQPQALEKTAQLLQAESMTERAALIHTGHEHMAEYVSCPVSAVVFNLGWLPGGDHGITTRTETTGKAVRIALDLLLPGGVLVLCAYPGHPEGDREREALTVFFSQLSNRQYNVLHQRFLNAGEGAPECFVIQKNRTGNKDALRKQYALIRKEMTEEDRTEKSVRTAERIAKMEEFRAASTVMVYSAVNGELSLQPLLNHPVSAGKRFVYPACLDRTEMAAMLPGRWRRGAYGIQEPDPECSESVDPEEIDLVICPGVAFDSRRTRLGMGAGYYDRFLPRCKKALVMMAAFEAQHAESLPREAQDYPMDRIVTEKRVY